MDSAPHTANFLGVLVGQDANVDEGQIYQTYLDLNGHQAMFGLTRDEESKKKYVLCCSHLQEMSIQG